MSFYEDNVSNALRFGDVVMGFVIATTQLKAPMTTGNPEQFNIAVRHFGLAVILSPCCSISDKTISVAPLIPVRSAFFKNDFFAKDLTRINRVMEPQNTLPSAAWEKMSEEEKGKRLSEGLVYSFSELFIYAGHSLLPTSTVNRKEGDIETTTCMIDFRDTHKVSCDKIINPKQSPLDSKLLELSIATRAELREKIAAYYSRVPIEDKAAED
jgi:hypothetical protein